jgi:hypothetical protein
VEGKYILQTRYFEYFQEKLSLSTVRLSPLIRGNLREWVTPLIRAWGLQIFMKSSLQRAEKNLFLLELLIYFEL